jgi:frataxin-like iron-binding protein CyaY
MWVRFPSPAPIHYFNTMLTAQQNDVIMDGFLENLFTSISDCIYGIGGECDYADGTLEIVVHSKTFVINKHFASGKIWYSSPVSKPKYYSINSFGIFEESTQKTNLIDDLQKDFLQLGVQLQINKN